MRQNYPGIIIAAPSSGSGKTTITLGVIRALSDFGQNPQAYKTGPDYIDGHYHSLSSGSDCHNLDPWAMREELIHGIICHLGANKLNIVEGVMGLFDGVTPDSGSTADLAQLTGWPIVLVIDASKQSHSLAALIYGFLNYREHMNICAIILNKVGSQRHKSMLLEAIKPLNIPVIGVIPRIVEISRPSRHLGLHQAFEDVEIESFIDLTAQHLKQHLDFDLLIKLAIQGNVTVNNGDQNLNTIPPIGERIAIAKDAAFSFIYSHFLTSWQRRCREISYFSPLDNEIPDSNCDAIFLPGGYPESHLEALEKADKFKQSMVDAASNGKSIYAECGGHMVLGQSITGANGQDYDMVGVLPQKCSFNQPKMTLGYRQLNLKSDSLLGMKNTVYRGHEFHYSCEENSPMTDTLFNTQTAQGEKLADNGYQLGSISSSYNHLIDVVESQNPDSKPTLI